MDQKWGARLFAITPTEETAKALFLDLKDVENLRILYYPSNGKMLYSSSISSIDNDAKKALLEMDGMRTGIIVTSLRAFISPVLSRAMMDEMTLSIALALQSELEERGYGVVMTREDDSTLSLEERCDVANSADFPIEAYPIFVSIHINSAHSEAAEGFEVYVKSADKRVDMLDEATSDKLALKYSSYSNAQLNAYKDIVSLSLADGICRRYEEAFPDIPMRGVKSGDLWVLNGTWMPSVLVEVGFISNPEEEARMALPDYQRKLAKIIAQAIEDL